MNTNVSMTDKIRIMDTNLSCIDYLIEGDIIYFKESQIAEIMENNDITSAAGICEAVLEQEIPGHYTDYKIIRDIASPGILAEFYIPKMFGDPLLESFDILASYNEGTSLSKEATWTMITKLLAKYKKGDYKEAKTVEYRLNKCKNELEHTKKELDNFNKNPNKKQIQKMYTFGFIIKSVAALGIMIATPVIAGKVGKVLGGKKLPGILGKAAKVGASTKIGSAIASDARNAIKSASEPVSKGAIKISALNAVNGTLDASQYEMYLKRYISELESCVSYLENAKKEAEKRDDDRSKKESVTESFLNPASIADIMCETGF